MTDHTDLIERLRDYSGTFDHACINESADALEAAQAEIEAQQHRIQALWMERDAALARIAELTKQEPVAWADDAAMRGSVGNVCSDAAKRYWAKSDWVDRKSVELHKHPLYAAAGASPVQPSQAGEHCLWARNGHQPCQHTQPAQHTQLIQQALGAAIPRRSKFNLGPAQVPNYREIADCVLAGLEDRKGILNLDVYADIEEEIRQEVADVIKAMLSAAPSTKEGQP